MIFTFWEGAMPAYIKLCFNTWRFPHVILNFETLNIYTDIPIDDRLKRFTLPQIADYVRVHVLRDNGGYWLDADTIIVTEMLQDVTIMGNVKSRTNTIGFLHAEPGDEMFVEWAEYQDNVLNSSVSSSRWDIMGNAFTDKYLQEHDVKIGAIDEHWPETYMIEGEAPRWEKYKKFYFEKSYELSDLRETNMLMLHNSWTPEWYKNLTEKQVLAQSCTLSNILNVLTA